jgi:hypothetical protein
MKRSFSSQFLRQTNTLANIETISVKIKDLKSMLSSLTWQDNIVESRKTRNKKIDFLPIPREKKKES